MIQEYTNWPRQLKRDSRNEPPTHGHLVNNNCNTANAAGNDLFFQQMVPDALDVYMGKNIYDLSPVVDWIAFPPIPLLKF